jgi:uncharacterized protein (TIGR03435 family)
MRPALWNVVSSLMIFCCALTGQTGARPEFEVASIKPAAPDARGSYIRPGPGGGVSITNMSLKDLIVMAWRVQPFQISGGPAWLDSIHYDIVAKPEARPKQNEIPEMLQALLEDRFQLKLNRETKELPIFALVMARKDNRLGPGFSESTAGDCIQPDPSSRPAPPQPGVPPPRYCGQMMMGLNRLTAVGVPVANLTPMLSRLLGRTVIDKTGLTENFNINVQWTPDETQALQLPPGAPAPPSDTTAPSLFTAFQEQLGLKLESQKGPVDILIIERAEKPSEN